MDIHLDCVSYSNGSCAGIQPASPFTLLSLQPCVPLFKPQISTKYSIVRILSCIFGFVNMAKSNLCGNLTRFFSESKIPIHLILRCFPAHQTKKFPRLHTRHRFYPSHYVQYIRLIYRSNMRIVIRSDAAAQHHRTARCFFHLFI